MSQPSEMENQAHVLFHKFLQGKKCTETLNAFRELCTELQLDHTDFQHLYQKLKGSLNYWKAKALWTKLDKRASHSDYGQGQACSGTKCLVLGAGPCGLRTAIELAFLGAKVILIEKRDTFSRNNVLHLWPFTIHDLKTLGAKKFYGKFCSGCLDHISIRQLQLMLLKVALILGIEIHVNVEFKGLIEPPKNQEKKTGWKAELLPANHPVTEFEFDVLVSAGGSNFIPNGFKKKEMRGKLAIGITANFVNRHSSAEAKVEEISGVASLYNQKFFQQLHNETGIDLENIVYYKDDTHYFVMTAKKQSLLKYGVIRQDQRETNALLNTHNMDKKSLLRYAHQAADFCTNHQLPDLEFALNHRGDPDVAMFDFTCMYRSENAALVRERHGHRLLVALVGDCLVEPFWPLGTGIARGFLAALDAAWLVRGWGMGTAPLELLAERESIYQLLSQTKPENTHKKVTLYSIDPFTRYPNLNLNFFKANQVKHLYDVGDTAKMERISLSSEDIHRNDTLGDVEQLLSWCKEQIEGYGNVKVVDLTTSWRNGLALCALLHKFRPNLIDFESLKETNVAENNQLAFDIAEREFGIPPIMTGTEMATATSPDKLSMVMYLTQLKDIFKDSSPEHQTVSKKSITILSAKSALLFLSNLRKTTASRHTSQANQENKAEEEMKQQNNDSNPVAGTETGSSAGGRGDFRSLTCEDGPDASNINQGSAHNTQDSITAPGSSEVCYFCNQRVYVVERFSAEGKFFHRGCFKCHLCKATLRLGGYAFHSGDGQFYCVPHYNSHALGSMQFNKPEDHPSEELDFLDGVQEIESVADRVPGQPTKVVEFPVTDGDADQETKEPIRHEEQREDGMEGNVGEEEGEDGEKDSEEIQPCGKGLQTVVEDNGSPLSGSSIEEIPEPAVGSPAALDLPVLSDEIAGSLSGDSVRLSHPDVTRTLEQTDRTSEEGPGVNRHLTVLPVVRVDQLAPEGSSDHTESKESISLPSQLSLPSSQPQIISEEKSRGDVVVSGNGSQTPRKKLALSSTVKHKLARLHTSSESDTETQEDEMQSEDNSDNRGLSESGGLLVPDSAVFKGSEPEDTEQECQDDSSPVLRATHRSSINEQARKSLVYWNMPCSDIEEDADNGDPEPRPSSQQPIQTQITQEKTPQEKGSAPDASSKPKFRLPSFNVFSRLSRRQKTSKDNERSSVQTAKPDPPTAQTPPSPQRQVSFPRIDDNESGEEDEEEIDLSSDEDTEYITEQPIKAKLTPEEIAERLTTWRLNAYQRRAKEEEIARFAKAQSIQRRLTEIEQMFHELEERGVLLEEEIRMSKGEQSI
ncbi:F-actin-monooxygenase MICAL2 [Callorhinchus milii]|uniref:F-actin-monooxygenase MICAL2 n=1 Tax=Callorhinchus milii TaxID=7868 RepID=UPI001C3F9DAE|nr:F-actin-monooxygenase MICAL2 [Callorhinchus milii]